MIHEQSRLNEVNVLVSEGNWAWPEALRMIFAPRGVNLLTARRPQEFVNVLEQKRIHTMIIDMDSAVSKGLATIRLIHVEYPLLPCILLTSTVSSSLLSKALQLEVFSVVGKPVNMEVLRELLNRLFLKKYGSDIFG